MNLLALHLWLGPWANAFVPDNISDLFEVIEVDVPVVDEVICLQALQACDVACSLAHSQHLACELAEAY